MNCGHPKSARAVRTLSDGSLVTECWACEIEYEKKRRPTHIGQILSGLRFRPVTEERDEQAAPVRRPAP